MDFLNIIWDLEEDPDGNMQHIAEHDLTVDDVFQILTSSDEEARSRSSGRPMVFGYLSDGRCICVVFEWIDDITIYPVTAYEVEG